MKLSGKCVYFNCIKLQKFNNSKYLTTRGICTLTSTNTTASNHISKQNDHWRQVVNIWQLLQNWVFWVLALQTWHECLKMDPYNAKNHKRPILSIPRLLLTCWPKLTKLTKLAYICLTWSMALQMGPNQHKTIQIGHGDLIKLKND